MKFLIYRTSGWIAVEDLERLDIDLKKYNVYLESHKNKDIHKEKNKYAIINIQSLEELMKLNKDYGDIVIQQPNYIKGTPEIEIYDTYRE